MITWQIRGNIAQDAAASAILDILKLDQQAVGSVKYSSGVPSFAPPRFSIRMLM